MSSKQNSKGKGTGKGKSTQRLDKVLSNMGWGSRADIKKMVKQGMIVVNNAAVKDPGMQVDPHRDILEVQGERVHYREYMYLMMNKPQGVISATEDKRDKTVIDLLSQDDRWLQPFPVGRLDKDTVGLLLITNDGQLAHELLSPKKHVPKTYEAYVQGNVDEEDVIRFREGVTLDDGYTTLPAELKILSREDEADGVKSHISLTIHEGKFHQVKRMFEAVGKKVVYLKRISMGSLRLDEALALGTYRELTSAELELLGRAQD
ncbi:rRNA pseudouridine synthase [Paenibacillus sp. F411]|uniref:pseudouridine synthase n=1 Tax=Paenibacillus sp. F411 TaxID=2820239 RepID=UPI001AB01DBD|nr:pseudouridine synthase [Paenibacillus sp. F411]MBO2942598.1 rRNA pseudouridine synthase [Paenibacillus sp. F411]